MYRFFLTLLLFNFSAVFITDLWSQPEASGHPPYLENATVRSLTVFTDSVYGKDIRLVNGRTYQPAHPRSAGHPYFMSQEWMDGSVIVGGQRFTNLTLQYDIYVDRLIYINRSADGSVSRLQLNNEQVSGFVIRGHRFITLGPAKVPGLSGPEYFEALVLGKVCLLNRWEKKFEQDNVEDFPFGRFSAENKTVFILKDGRLQKIKNRSFVMKFLENKKSELKQFMKEQKLNGFHLEDNELTDIINFYNNLL